MSKSNALTPVQELRGSLQAMSGEFQKALPSYIPVDHFIRVVQTAIQTNPKLLQCDRSSLFAACVKSAECGLLPDGEEGAIIPYGGEAKFRSMVRGLKKLATNSREIGTMLIEILYKEDHFRRGTGANGPFLEWEQSVEENRGEPLGAFALIVTKDKFIYSDYMTKKEIEKIRDDYAKGTDRADSPWKRTPHEMWKKTVFRRLSKTAPMSKRLEVAAQTDDEIIDVVPQEDKPEALPEKTTSNRLQEAVENSEEAI